MYSLKNFTRRVVNDGSCASTDFEQEMYGRHPKQFVSPDGGLDPIVSESTDGPIRTQCIHNPIWNGLMNGKAAAG